MVLPPYLEATLMFERLFIYPNVLRRHRQGPLAAGRVAFLEGLADRGMAQGTLRRCASCCLRVAMRLQRWPADRHFSTEELSALAGQWAMESVRSGRAVSTRWSEAHLRVTAVDFLRSLGRLRAPLTAPPGRYDGDLSAFLAEQREHRWLSSATCASGAWQVRRFLKHLEERGITLGEVTARDVDGYFSTMAERWSRSSLRTCAKALRPWFAYCEAREDVRPGLADTILLPRLYRHAGLPLGPSWEEVGRLLVATAGGDRPALRDHAILLLLSVYGLRSGEVRRLSLDDLDWQLERLRVVRSKGGRQQTFPLEPSVGNAIARYLRHGRPASDSRVVFLTQRAPHRPLSAGALYTVVAHRLADARNARRKELSPRMGRGPHGLRHACARHLLAVGRTMKEIGDHLGHRSPDTTRLYAKVDLASLRRVALEDVGGLA
jgi:integrase/recombinase XerD